MQKDGEARMENPSFIDDEPVGKPKIDPSKACPTWHKRPGRSLTEALDPKAGGGWSAASREAFPQGSHFLSLVTWGFPSPSTHRRYGVVGLRTNTGKRELEDVSLSNNLLGMSTVSVRILFLFTSNRFKSSTAIRRSSRIDLASRLLTALGAGVRSGQDGRDDEESV
jgi:hypothetical protein